jgi:hypothetical protein
MHFLVPVLKQFGYFLFLTTYRMELQSSQQDDKTTEAAKVAAGELLALPEVTAVLGTTAVAPAAPAVGVIGGHSAVDELDTITPSKIKKGNAQQQPTPPFVEVYKPLMLWSEPELEPGMCIFNCLMTLTRVRIAGRCRGKKLRRPQGFHLESIWSGG